MRLRRFLPFAAAAAFIAIGVGVGLGVHRAPDDPPSAPTPARAAPPVRTTVGAPAPAHAGFDTALTRPAPSARQPGGDWRAFEAKLAGAQSLRAFVYEVLRQPKEGGVYYAFWVLTQCKANLGKDTDGVPVPQRQSIEAMRARCDFSGQELDDAYRQIAAIRNLNFADDPILGPVFSFLKAKDDGARAAVLGAVIDTGNPIMIGAIVSTAIGNALPPGIVAPREEPGNYRWYTTMLVECQLGADCSGERSLMELCTKNGWCAANVRDALRIGLGDKFAPLDQLATRMTNDIRKRNYPPLLRGA
jgi:hypothetical protein